MHFLRPNKFLIDGNVYFLHSQYIFILTSLVTTQFLCTIKTINNSYNFRLKHILTVK